MTEAARSDSPPRHAGEREGLPAFPVFYLSLHMLRCQKGWGAEELRTGQQVVGEKEMEKGRD